MAFIWLRAREGEGGWAFVKKKTKLAKSKYETLNLQNPYLWVNTIVSDINLYQHI